VPRLRGFFHRLGLLLGSNWKMLGLYRIVGPISKSSLFFISTKSQPLLPTYLLEILREDSRELHIPRSGRGGSSPPAPALAQCLLCSSKVDQPFLIPFLPFLSSKVDQPFLIPILTFLNLKYYIQDRCFTTQEKWTQQNSKNAQLQTR
jgi:hypothetical protein